MMNTTTTSLFRGPRRISVGLFFVLIAVSAASSRTEAAGKYVVRVVTDRTEAVYKSGETARFLVTVTNSGRPVTGGTVSYVVSDFIPGNRGFPKGSLRLDGKPVVIEAKLARPGFLLCRVSFLTPDKKRVQAAAGAGFSPLSIKPSLPVPDDFDRYWNEQKQKLAKVAMAPKLTPVVQADKNLDCYDVQVQCLGGAPVSGYLAKPKGAKPKSLPAILWVHGAGVRSSSLRNAVQGAKAGMLSMDVNAHGIPNGKPPAFYRKLNAGRLKGYRHAGRQNRDTSYFRGMFLRLVRAIDFLTAQPEWDGKIVAVIGHSQGGGQALVAGGIDKRVTIIAAGVPAICDHSGRVAGRINGWPKLVPMRADGRPDPMILKASRYVDAVNFASRCKAEAIMSVGFIDTTCPPSSCYAAYNVLQGSKQILNEPLMRHAAPSHIRAAFFKRIQEHVRSHSARR